MVNAERLEKVGNKLRTSQQVEVIEQSEEHAFGKLWNSLSK